MVNAVWLSYLFPQSGLIESMVRGQGLELGVRVKG